MSHANRTSVQALWALDSYESTYKFISNQQFARRSTRVQQLTWGPWILPHDGMWWAQYNYIHVVRNGENAGNVGQDFKSFFGIACGCGNVKKGRTQRIAFQTCSRHRIGEIKAISYVPLVGTPIGHSSARPTAYTVGPMTIPATPEAQLAPIPPMYGPVTT